MLEADGHTVALATAGEEAVTLVARDAFDVVLEPCTHARHGRVGGNQADPRPAGAAGLTPIIGVSADAAREDVNECLAAGMTGYIAKPLDRQALQAELRRVTSDKVLSQPAPVPG